MAERELITAAFGNYGNLVAAQYINGTSRYDMEHSVLYFENSKGTRMPRVVMIDHQHPSRIVAELDINKVTEVPNGESNKESYTAMGYSDPYSGLSAGVTGRRVDETEEAYAERMYLNDESLDENAFYGGAAIGERVRAQRRLEREGRTKKQVDGNVGNNTEEKTGEDAGNAGATDEDEEGEETIPIFNVKDPLVPWYRYIIPPLHRTSYTLMRSSHTDPRGTSLLHSFGHGLAATGPTSAPPELQHTWENLRYQLEAADRCQGFQFFVDADGALGGFAHATIRHIHDEFDDEIPIATHALFLPFNLDMVEDDFAKQRSQELILNHALSTHYLSTDSSSIYVPYRISEWAAMWGSCDYVNDNVATAQMVAAAIDTGFYATRDGENRIEGPVGEGQGTKPLSAFADALKPAPSYRVCSAFAALPFSVKTRGMKQTPPSFSEMLQDHPLLPVVDNATSAVSVPNTTYRPLTHKVTKDPSTDAGRVHGQTFTLRGIGGLADRDYPRLEAISRFYLYPTRCSRVIATVTDVGYAVSSTFSPSILGFPAEADLSQLPHTPMAAHYCATSSITPMLKQLIADATPIIRYGIRGASSPLRESYGLEMDEWSEVLESLNQLRDDYDHDDQREDEDDYS